LPVFSRGQKISRLVLACKASRAKVLFVIWELSPSEVNVPDEIGGKSLLEQSF